MALLAIWPVLIGPTQQMIGHDQGDVWNHAWGSWWFWQSLLDGTLPWHTEWLNAPNGGTLWFIDPIGALIGLPFTALFGPILAFNATVLVYAATTSWAAHAQWLNQSRGSTAWLRRSPFCLVPTFS